MFKKLIKFILPGLFPYQIISGGIGFGTSQGEGQSTGKSSGQSLTGGPVWQRPYQQFGAGEAARLYSQGGATPWQGPNVAGFSPEQLAAQQGITNYVNDPNTAAYLQGGYGAVNQLLSTGAQPYTNATTTGFQTGTNYLGSEGPQTYGSLNEMINGQPTNQYLNQGTGALNSFLGGPSNAYTSEAVQAAINPLIDNFRRNILPKLRLSYGGNVGNTGQGIAEGLASSDLTRQLADIASGIGYKSWSEQQANKMNAANALTSQGQNMLQNRLQGLGLGLSDLQNKAQLGLSTGLQGAGLDLNRLSTGLNNLVTPMNASMGLYDKLGAVGADKQALQQANIEALKQQWEQNQQAPWQNLAQYLQAVNQNYGALTQEAGTTYGKQKTAGKTSSANLSGGI